MNKHATRYTAEQKEQALALAEELGNLAEAGRQLGLNSTTLYRWKDQAVKKKKRAASKPKETAEQRRIRELERELRAVKQERDFLKKAASYFAREDREKPSK